MNRLVVGGVLIGFATAMTMAFSGPQDLGTQALNLSRSAGQGGPVTTSIPDANTTACLESAPGSNTCAVFGLGSLVPVQVSQPGTCCWSGDDSLAIGAQGAETASTLGGSTRACSGHTFGVAGESHDMVADWNVIRKVDVGKPSLWCSTKVLDPFGIGVYPPCVNDADCTALSAGTCTRGSEADGGIHLLCRHTAASLTTANPER